MIKFASVNRLSVIEDLAEEFLFCQLGDLCDRPLNNFFWGVTANSLNCETLKISYTLDLFDFGGLSE